MDINENYQLSKAETNYQCQPLVKQRNEMMEIIKLVAHEFGRGNSYIQQLTIEKARKFLEGLE